MQSCGSRWTTHVVGVRSHIVYTQQCTRTLGVMLPCKMWMVLPRRVRRTLEYFQKFHRGNCILYSSNRWYCCRASWPAAKYVGGDAAVRLFLVQSLARTTNISGTWWRDSTAPRSRVCLESTTLSRGYPGAWVVLSLRVQTNYLTRCCRLSGVYDGDLVLIRTWWAPPPPPPPSTRTRIDYVDIFAA